MSRQSGMTGVTFLATGLDPYWRMAKSRRAIPAKHSKKDPAKPTRAKAARPDAPALDRFAWRTCSIRPSARAAPGGAQTGSPASPRNTGLKPPPDNSWDRRADFANAHRARASVARGFGEAPQQGYVGKTPVAPGELDPDLAKALGIEEPDDDSATPGVIKYGDRHRHGAATRSPAAGRATGIGAFGSAASQQSLDHLLREGRAEFRDSTCGRRTGRRGRTNPKAAAASSSSPISIRRATSRRRSPNWSKACSATTAPRCCSASPAPARPSPWPR